MTSGSFSILAWPGRAARAGPHEPGRTSRAARAGPHEPGRTSRAARAGLERAPARRSCQIRTRVVGARNALPSAACPTRAGAGFLPDTSSPCGEFATRTKSGRRARPNGRISQAQPAAHYPHSYLAGCRADIGRMSRRTSAGTTGGGSIDQLSCRPCAWSLAHVSLRVSVRLKTGWPGVASRSGEK
jgi:hypothetical protein